jgi:hypothetical protein
VSFKWLSIEVSYNGDVRNLTPERPLKMRITTRIMVGAGAAALLAAGAPAVANAATPPVPGTVPGTVVSVIPSSHSSFDTWGPYSSSDGKAKAQGKVVVQKESHRQWYWKTEYKVFKVCKWYKGDRKCHWVKKPYKKHVWKWVHQYNYTVSSTLKNYKWWGDPRYRCAWETFRIVNFNGSTSYKSFKNCGKSTASYSFSGTNAKDIDVKVGRGTSSEPKGYRSGWQSVYSA